MKDNKEEIELYTTIAEPKGLYGASLDDELYAIKIVAILQLEKNGLIKAETEFGLISFDFDFVGSLEELERYKEENINIQVFNVREATH